MSAVFGLKPMPKKDFTELVKKLKLCCRVFDNHLKGKEYLVGNALTVADVVCVFKFLEPY